MTDIARFGKVFGTYSPGPNTRGLRTLIRFGLARGIITKRIKKRWPQAHGLVVDAEIRNIKYRLDLSDNTNDIKLLLSSKTYDGIELVSLIHAAKGNHLIRQTRANFVFQRQH